jgi:hypothetical protein
MLTRGSSASLTDPRSEGCSGGLPKVDFGKYHIGYRVHIEFSLIGHRVNDGGTKRMVIGR